MTIRVENDTQIDQDTGSNSHYDFVNSDESIDVSSLNLDSLLFIKLIGEHLNRFNASYNVLSIIPPNYFINAPNLRKIDVSFNNLIEIESTTFAGAIKLTYIDLSFNRIAKIDDESFKHLNLLEFVNLMNNHIFQLNFKFSDQTPLNTLNLENNPISYSAGYDFCIGNTVKTVHYSWNQMKELELSAGNHFTVVVNVKGDFEGIKLKSKNHFEFHCNKNSFIQLSRFIAGPNRSENVVDFLQCFSGNVKYLDLSGNFVGNLNADIFKRFVKLSILLLNDVKLTSFDFNVLISNKIISELDISFNNLTTVYNSSSMKILKTLSDFKAAGNRLNNTAEIIQNLNAFAGVLDLSDSIVSLNATTLSKFHEFDLLYLRNTDLSFSSVDPFDVIKMIHDLDISYNNLSEIDLSVLANTLQKLWRFRCAHCQIRNALDIMQYMNKNLHLLDLSGNSLEHVGDNMFKIPNNINFLNLSDANISSFDFSVFRYFVQLKIIRLSQNNLREIDAQFLPYNAVNLHLEDNDLVRIDNLNRTLYPYLSYLDISHNRLPCKYLVELVKEWNDTFLDDPWQQKHGKDCRLESSHSIEHADTTNFWPIIAIVLTIIGIVIGAAFFFGVWQPRRGSSSENYQHQSDFNSNNEQSETTSYCSEEIYEEIGPTTITYDKLKFDFSPLPISINNNHYENLKSGTPKC